MIAVGGSNPALVYSFRRVSSPNPPLPVHEKAVRRWEERGLLRAVRLPSGVRRFRPDHVEAKRAEMFSGFAPQREDDDVVPVTRVSSID